MCPAKPTHHALLCGRTDLDARATHRSGCREPCGIEHAYKRYEGGLVPFSDLREFIAELDDLNELRGVDGADWDLELGTICELNYERQGPALLFDNIKGYPKGYRVLTNGQETFKRALCSIEFPLEMSLDEALA